MMASVMLSMSENVDGILQFHERQSPLLTQQNMIIRIVIHGARLVTGMLAHPGS